MNEEIERVTSGGVPVRVERFARAGSGPGPAAGSGPAVGFGPAVLLLHGSDGLARSGGYRQAARGLAAAGFTVFLPHYLDRTGETQASFSRIGANVPAWRSALADVLDHVAGRPEVDPARLGLVGISLGAALALDLAAGDARIAALVDCFGFLPPGLPEREGLRLPPTLVLHGARDAIVPVANAHALAALLARLGVPHDVAIYPDQAHGFSGGAEADVALRTASFLRRHLAPRRAGTGAGIEGGPGPLSSRATESRRDGMVPSEGQFPEHEANPFSEPAWTAPHGLPPFERITPAHYLPAFDRALGAHEAEIDAIAGNPEPPTFANTLGSLERSGTALRRVSSTFFNLTGAHTNPELQAVERTMAPRLARHRSALFLNAALFARVQALTADGLTPEEARVLERYRTIFRRAGADRGAEDKERLAAISARLAELGTAFSQNLLADERDYELALEGEADLAGLPAFLISASAKAAEERGKPGGHVITLSRSLIEPFLVFSTRRDLRARAYEAWIRRGENGGETDNRAIIAETLALRAERAKLLGYESFAHFKLADTMAGSPEAAMGLLTEVWAPARARIAAERDRLQTLMRAEGVAEALAPSDWRHYAEKLRRAEHDLDEEAVKAHLPLDGVIAAAFDTATRLFGLSFTELQDVPRYHPDVRAFEVKDREGEVVGLFLGDYFARASKRSGAWMSAFRSQERLTGEVTPIIVNVMNFAQGAEGAPSLLSFDDARTLFHEFGHALHGLLSDVTYPLLAGTAVAGDFVELPSQLYEHWLEEPDVLARFARHHATGEPMPADLIRKVLAARGFGQGFSTVEYTASAIVDLDLHLAGEGVGDPLAATQATLERLGMPAEIAMRHRTPHFAHVFAGEGYAAGYYSYLWSEVLDADAFDAFREAGDPFDPETARRLREHVYAAGNLRDARTAYTGFRGRLPDTAPLLRQRGLALTAA